jgi:DNA-binding MarR family transcriptional regulator
MFDTKQLVEKILHTLSLVTSADKRQKLELEGVTLYSSEIHLLMFVYTEQDTNITKIADKLGLTKGAISQTVTRLENKGIIQKETDPYNKNELTILFTPKGKKIRDRIIMIREMLQNHFLQYLHSLSDRDKQVIDGFLNTVASVFQRHQ